MASGTPDSGAAAVVPARWPDDASARSALEDFLRAGGDGEPFSGVDADLHGAVLDGVALDGAWLNGARLDGVGLRGASLFDVRLNGVSLRRADLTGAVLNKSVLDDADARDAVLDDADLMSVEAFATDLRGALLRRTQWAGALLKCDLRGADLSGAVFDETAMRGCRLGGATVTGARGALFGPIDVSSDGGSQQLEGDDLAWWFHDRGAVDVIMREPARRR